MILIVQHLINGSLMGIIYALIALGLSLIFGVLKIINFAHGAFLMLSMYATFLVSTYVVIDAIFTPLITFPVFFIIGLVIYHRLIDKTMKSPAWTQITITVGLMILLQAAADIIFSAKPKGIPYSIVHGGTEIGGYIISFPILFSAVLSLVIIIFVHFFLTRTYTGLSIRAVSDDSDAAALSGMNVKRIFGLSFGLGLGLIAIVAALLMTFQQVNPLMGIRFAILSWCVVVLAGLGSIFGLIISGLIIGVAESLTMVYWVPMARTLMIFIIFILILWIKPTGLFGRTK